MQAAVSFHRTQERDPAGNLAHHTWLRVKALLSGTPTAPSQAICTNGSPVKPKSTQSRKQKMLLLAAEMLQQHKRLSMLVFAIRDLPELEEVFGHPAAKQAVAIAAGKLGSLASNARAIRTAPTLLTLLVPEWEGRRALDAVFAAFGKPCCLELQVDGQGVVVLPELAVHTVEAETASIGEIYEHLCRAVLVRHPHRSHHRSLDDCEQLARTRPAAKPFPRLEYPPMPPTIPVKLAGC